MAITLDGNNGITSPDFEPSSSTVPTNGLFLPTTNTLAWATNSTERLRLDASGNLGLGVTPSAWLSGRIGFDMGTYGAVAGNNSGGISIFYNSYRSASAYVAKNTGQCSFYDQSAGSHYWYNSSNSSITGGASWAPTQAMTLDASGNLLVGTTSLGNRGCSIVSKGSGFVWEVQQTGGAGTSCQGITYSASSPNSASDYFLYCIDSTAARANIRSNGGLANYSANNVNLSDERVKTDITPAPSWLAKINAIEVVNFKYKDQTHDDFNLGAIAQQVQSVAPELVDTDGFGETPEDGVPLMAIYETDLKYAMLKAIQELTARLEALENK